MGSCIPFVPLLSASPYILCIYLFIFYISGNQSKVHSLFVTRDSTDTIPFHPFCLLHYRWILYQLSCQGIPDINQFWH